ncbi:STAS-like domain-containing protein [Tabrizicola sp.]|uniref:STAS-like domain-containing protein n=1 Tax=Tabrizicola sp. TaxID=2005166 RepID=UPI003F3E322C
MDETVKINVATEFSKFPSGRDDADGPFNGTKFRKELLLPRLQEAMQKKVKLVVELDGVLSFGSSFLEESFGGLIRRESVLREDLEATLVVLPGWEGNKRYSDAIARYIKDARKESH